MKAAGTLLLVLIGGLGSLRAGDTEIFAAVRHADDERIAATIAGDTQTLARVLSDDLHYAHSDGRVQTKSQFIGAVGGNKVKYLSVVPEDVKLQFVAPGAVAMNGRARLTAQTSDGRRVGFAIRFLGVWREESGQWRLIAYQSSPLAETR